VTSVAAPPVRPPFAWRHGERAPWIEARLPGAVAAFSTRLGGVSDGPYRALNLGILTDDDPGSVRRNRELLAAALDRDPAGLALGRQVHGSEVELRRKGSPPVPPGADLCEADAQASDYPDLTPLVLVADCVPLLLAGAGAVAAVHCGWRGVAAGVVENALASLRELGAAPGEIGAAIGPGIGPCCYEVGEEVASRFQERGGPPLVRDGRLDLPLAVRGRLERAGLDRAAIASVGLCTSCHPELFFSHRRDGGLTGRQAGLAWLRA
jgi:polyphenol oxidase